jgi:DNA-binding transcriptional LysR family regulator
MPNKTNTLINRLSFRQLQVFLTVYQQSSYSKAGHLLGLTQPAVSSQIRALEQATDTQLFDYIGKKLHYTAAGKRLAQSTEHIFSELDTLNHDLDELKGIVSGELKLVGVNTAQYIIPYLLGPFLNLYPQIKINVSIVNRSSAIERLSNNSDDLVIMGMVPEDKPFISLPFLSNELVAVAPKNHPLVTQKDIKLEDFLNSKLLLRESGSGTRLALEDYCRQKRQSLSHFMELGSNDTIKHAVIAGLGVAILPKLSILPELELGALKLINLQEFPLKRSWCLVFPKAKHPTPTMKAFYDFIQQNIKHFEWLFSEQANLEAHQRII